MFDKNGNVVPVTLVEAGPCTITQLKNKEKDGYEATQIGFTIKKKHVKKTEKGKEFRYLREVAGQNGKTGDIIDVSIFQEGDIVKVAGVSKGKGFQGAVKRWGFHGRKQTHGVKHEHRTVGSIGASFPARIIKGKKMPGRMGADRVTVKNLEVMKADKENNLLVLKGAVPGIPGALLEIIAK